ncbi:tRNA (guanosine(46)-N7)-methyltransferase TrmB [Bacillus pseudomycoides]|uniref:tRNA (guanosine(46)-N7)-methyltransferase TrmB n=1 Tax=Bacillus pseudomycoides TaxID=64104 RepID=UPI000BEDCE0B|nr:tRNA (guanosine(46)-N7)-methyltransferase TrmB [Bacillus pseudomycoides]MED4652032.1 tRNA (guanosine(46)-N7)-methyltransferase TrmB [Bacillus pseudomycoides]PEE05911.1 tRNA (guanosine(46)-N7)-methyltransferase TrmB [Bacillus pseudomycoides]PEM74481.1 tRNA (guanosine(46)-N7)-methyltransferase TrmB [Bacillus pseudomycoides]PHC87680.1 tRNA (guanosine(46)-N7)-methyltransferase TrmB [Bacillus pseudomycoides]
MRLRHKPYAMDRINEYSQFVIGNPEERCGNWKEVFGNNHPIHIEVGTGRGRFVYEMAKANPHINYIGIEKFTSVIVDALDRLIEEEVPNLKLINKDAEDLTVFFAEGEIDRVYLNFSDPWPKNRHEKRRLTYKTFLRNYEEVLVTGGEIHFKTDNQSLFEYSLMSMAEYGMLLTFLSLDLHNSDFEGNIMTEYEEKFSSKGHRIYRVEAKYRTESVQ